MKDEVDWKARAEMYRRQLGGTEAALRRARQRIKELEGGAKPMRVEGSFIDPDAVGTLTATKDGTYPGTVEVSGPVGVIVYGIERVL